jgi:predicted metalloprotease
MRWRGRRQSSNIEYARSSRRGASLGGLGRGAPMRLPLGRGGGGIGIGSLVILVVLYFALRACGIDPLAMMEEGQPGGTPFTQEEGTPVPEEMREFVAVVLAETEDVWHGLFEAQGAVYEEPTLTLFSGGVSSACGFASSAAGPFYCPGDDRIYLDTSFFGELDRRFGASGDFAQAYVIAHEVGHHVQNLAGILPRVNQMRAQMGEAESNRMSVRVELQADCFAGVWAHFTAQRGLLEEGDLEEALNAARQIGDDTLQKRSQGYVVPESFSHGTSAQRQEWFARGFRTGRIADCDTFDGAL